MTYLTAQVTDVAIGNFTIAGLMDEQGNYYIGVPQLNEQISFGTSNNTISRDLKRLLGNDFRPSKAKTDLYNQLINVIPLVDFERLLAKLDRLGNVKAQELRDSLVGLSLHQLFSDKFNVKFEQEDRQKFLKARLDGIDTRRQLTDAIKDYCDRHPERSEGFKKFVYSNCTDIIYLALFKKKASQLREEFKCVGDLRNYFADSNLKEVERREGHAIQLIDKDDIDPVDAVKAAVLFYS